MARNKKTVRKGFNYRNCDDFAAYLNHMARQGWHFKEWRAGLVFEKGAPEEAVYAVEIFPDGTVHDMRPSYKAENFGEYCEAAGWNLIDQRVKWCVLKRVREDAVPIFTDEERFENVKSVTPAGPGKFIWVELLILAAMICMIWYSPKVYLFSPSQILWSVYWPLVFMRDLHQTIDHRRWCRDCEARLERGEMLYFRKRSNSVLAWAIGVSPLLVSIAYFLNFDFFSMKIVWIITGIFIFLTVLLSYLPGRLRIDSVSSQLFTVLYWVIFFFYLISVLVIASYQNYQKQDSIPSEVPAEQEVYSYDTGSSATVFGTKYTSDLHIGNYQSRCNLYKSEYTWVLDTVWTDACSEYDASWVDCTDMWNANAAFRTMNGYIVRYEDRILVFPRIGTLTQEEIDSILHILTEG